MGGYLAGRQIDIAVANGRGSEKFLQAWAFSYGI
jgi:hypothetical protein